MQGRILPPPGFPPERPVQQGRRRDLPASQHPEEIMPGSSPGLEGELRGRRPTAGEPAPPGGGAGSPERRDAGTLAVSGRDRGSGGLPRAIRAGPAPRAHRRRQPLTGGNGSCEPEQHALRAPTPPRLRHLASVRGRPVRPGFTVAPRAGPVPRWIAQRHRTRGSSASAGGRHAGGRSNARAVPPSPDPPVPEPRGPITLPEVERDRARYRVVAQCAILKFCWLILAARKESCHIQRPSGPCPRRARNRPASAGERANASQ